MKKSRFTESQIIAVLKEVDAGKKVEEACRQHGISNATYYNWKSKYGGMDACDVERLTGLEEENAETMTRVLRLSHGSLDLDFLDERARLILGLNRIDERVFFNDAPASKPE